MVERTAMFRRSLKTLLAVRFNNLFLVVLCVLLGVSLASGGFRVQRASAQQGSTTSPQEQKALLHALEDAFTSIADQVEPSVVTVEARANARPTANQPPAQDGGDDQQDGPFSLPDLFRRFGQPQPRSEGPSTGSGFVVRRRGNDAFVLTNNHVVAD